MRTLLPVLMFCATLPVLAQLAAQDARISDFRVHGSASGAGAAIDRWSDLDVLITAAEPSTAAEDLAREICRRLSPVYAADRGGIPPPTPCGWC